MKTALSPASVADVEQFDVFEFSVEGAAPHGSAVDIDLIGVFRHGEDETRVRGFFDGAGTYRVRFMPERVGTWTYRIDGSAVGTHGGTFTVKPAASSNHGPVRAEGRHFRYADGTVFAPFGTTAYAWIHQPAGLVQETLDTLAAAPFNKVRMCLFPKSMVYNTDEPASFPFARDAEGAWDVHHPTPEFWDGLDRAIEQLRRRGIEADLILFHPYDRWGLAALTPSQSRTYLDYCVRRLSAHRNLWWSLANEYDLDFGRSLAQWEELGSFTRENDPHDHLLSVHNWVRFYDFDRPWITHCSIQSTAVHHTANWRERYDKPVVNDECGYEGDIEEQWGHLTGFELVHRIWCSVLKGGYATHGETFLSEDDVLWWSKGGRLKGTSAHRIAFLRALVQELGGILEPDREAIAADPNAAASAVPAEHRDNPYLKTLLALDPREWEHFLVTQASYSARAGDDAVLAYLGHSAQRVAHLDLPEQGEWTIELIDVWQLTRIPLPGRHSGRTRVEIPGSAGTALLARRLDGVSAGPEASDQGAVAHDEEVRSA